VFLGTHAPRLDEKGRLILPAKYRDELAGGVVITKGQERCLYVFPQEEFARITEALRTAPVTAKSVRDYSRVFFASALRRAARQAGPDHRPARAAYLRGTAA
jgi:MraZ protein